ncbi:MAG: leucyl aminopeptidase, partial [Cyanobacteria bacterium P01_H01_bin.130]
MQLHAVETTAIAWAGAGLAIGLWEGETDLSGDWAALDERLGGTLSEIIEEASFKAKAKSVLSARVGGDVRKIIVVGLGKKDEADLETLRQAAGAVAKTARSEKCDRLGVALPVLDDAAGSVQAISEGIQLALHQDKRFKSSGEDEDEPKETPETIELLLPGVDGAIAQGALAAADSMVTGTVLSRELVAAPANVVTPVSLAALARELGDEHGLSVDVLGQEECEAQGMGSFLGVAAASDLPPQFIHMTYRPEGTPRKKLGIIGKGLTFDSGGLNIKAGAGSGIAMMKTDMGGAGAMFGAAKAIALLKPDVEVHFITASTENMISGRAMHPGDILTASNGKTIEVNNTDAEGRLTLADALVYADKLGLDAMVDLATLTGACIVALGNSIAGLWSSDEDLSADLSAAGKTSGEKFWPMPIENSYKDGLKSVVADMKNTGPRPGGAITATLFLQEFVETTPWAHIDLAGPIWSDSGSGINPAGATGFGVRT